MRGLPPLPFEVLELAVTIDVNGSEVGIVQHFHAPGSIAWGYSEFQEFVYGWGTFCEIHLLNCMPVEASFTTCRLSRFGTTPFRYVTVLPTNAGAHGQCQSLNSAVCFTWHTSIEGYESRSHTRVPIAADALNDDKRTLHVDFWANYVLQASEYVAACNSIVVGTFDLPTFVVVSRAQSGRPRDVSAFAPVVSGDVSLKVGTLRARI